MRVLISPTAFKETLTADEVTSLIADAWHKVRPSDTLITIPLADGGDGTLDILIRCMGADIIQVEVHDPLGRKLKAKYGLKSDTAVVELAQAAGIKLLAPNERNPLKTSTYGVGELIMDAIKSGARKVILGVGGSATNDAGLGILKALGFKFYDKDGREVWPCGGSLSQIVRVEPTRVDIDVTVLSDVINPLLGELGAARVYGPQKGAAADEVRILEKGLTHIAGLHPKGREYAQMEMMGAAGGVPFGLRMFLNAEVVLGAAYIMKVTGWMDTVRTADLIITGEGRIDRQTCFGKVTYEVIRVAQRLNKPVLVVCGEHVPEFKPPSNVAIFPLLREISDRTRVFNNATLWLQQVVTNLARYADLMLG